MVATFGEVGVRRISANDSLVCQTAFVSGSGAFAFDCLAGLTFDLLVFFPRLGDVFGSVEPLGGRGGVECCVMVGDTSVCSRSVCVCSVADPCKSCVGEVPNFTCGRSCCCGRRVFGVAVADPGSCGVDLVLNFFVFWIRFCVSEGLI